MTGTLYTPPRTVAPDDLLVNSNFRNPVNQRGKTIYTPTSISYTIDRWMINGVSSGAGELDITGDGVRVSPIQDYVDLSQNIEQYSRLKGHVCTAVVCANGEISSGCCYMGETADPVTLGPVKLYSINARNVIFRAYEPVTLQWAALYEGVYTADMLPPYIPRPYGVVLTECQRYYYQTWDGPTPATTAGIVACEAITDARLGVHIALPVQMRITPTITFYNSSGETGTWKEWISGTRVSVSAVYNNSKSFMVGAEKAVKGLYYAGHYCASCEP
ncbi:hypothetical protein [Beduinella massiliensis]|uniref:hypothetical protein n=1 Tax=Beduinella massiliensis TaxID=1852363 RepID=UPI0011AF9069